MNEKLILVIDDSQFLCTMLKKSLDSVGYNTLVAHTMEDGMQLFEQSRPDLVLLDINLPDTPGPKACKAIKSNPQYSNISVILMSGSYEEYIKKQVNECGANGYIKKPFSPSSILRWVKENSSALFSCSGLGYDEDSDERPYTLDDIQGKSAIPVVKPLAPVAQPKRTGSRPLQFSGEGRTIVITDDSTFLCAILKDTLEKVGFMVHTFPNIRETGYFLKNNHADLLFLDVNLPDIAGDRACSIIKDSPKTKNLPIILISSAEQEQLQHLTNVSGADGFLIKPFTPLNVLDWMKTNASNLFFAPQAVEAATPNIAVAQPTPPEPVMAQSAAKSVARPALIEKHIATYGNPMEPLEEYDGVTDGEIDILVKQLGSPLKEVRLDACYTLGEFKVHRAVADLMGMLEDSDDEIKGEAAWALGEIGDCRALQPILALLATQNNWLQDRAIEALGKFGDDRAVPPLVNILQTGNREMKVTAVKALAGIPCQRSIDALEQAVAASDEEVAANATWALRKLDSSQV